MSVDLGRIKPGFQNSQLKEFGLALMRAAELVMAAAGARRTSSSLHLTSRSGYRSLDLSVSTRT